MITGEGRVSWSTALSVHGMARKFGCMEGLLPTASFAADGRGSPKIMVDRHKIYMHFICITDFIHISPSPSFPPAQAGRRGQARARNPEAKTTMTVARPFQENPSEAPSREEAARRLWFLGRAA